jgi:hypothetical protein
VRPKIRKRGTVDEENNMNRFHILNENIQDYSEAAVILQHRPTMIR